MYPFEGHLSFWFLWKSGGVMVMSVFWILLLTPIIVQHFAIRNRNNDYTKKNKRIVWFFFVFLALLLMFRHESVGTDTKNYISYFNKFSRVEWGAVITQSGEIGFSYFYKIIAIFSKEPHIFISIVAISICFMMYPTYKRLCIDPSLTFILFCTLPTFVMMFSGIRQMLAIGLGFIAYEFTRKRKRFLYILIVGLALTIHTSAFMLLLMYPLYHTRITKNWLYIVIPVLASIFVFNKQIFSLLGLILERYTNYSATIEQTGAYTMLILFSLFAVIAFVFPEDSLLDIETIGLRNFLLLSLAIQMFAPLHTIAMRMNYYYIVFIPLLIPKIIDCKSKRWTQVALVSRHIMVLFFLGYFFVNAYSGSSDNLNVFPYHFFWEKF